MSWFSDFIRQISGSEDLYSQAEASQARTGAALDTALAAQADAKKRAELAATPPIDKESTVRAGEARARKLLSAAGFRFSGQPLGDAPIGYTRAFGE